MILESAAINMGWFFIILGCIPIVLHIFTDKYKISTYAGYSNKRNKSWYWGNIILLIFIGIVLLIVEFIGTH